MESSNLKTKSSATPSENYPTNRYIAKLYSVFFVPHSDIPFLESVCSVKVNGRLVLEQNLEVDHVQLLH